MSVLPARRPAAHATNRAFVVHKALWTACGRCGVHARVSANMLPIRFVVHVLGAITMFATTFVMMFCHRAAIFSVILVARGLMRIGSNVMRCRGLHRSLVVRAILLFQRLCLPHQILCGSGRRPLRRCFVSRRCPPCIGLRARA